MLLADLRRQICPHSNVHFLESGLLYLVSLILLIKLFLVSQDKLQEPSVAEELIGVVLLTVSIVVKRRRALGAVCWTVKRGSEDIMAVETSHLELGDILLIRESQPLPVNGIVLKVSGSTSAENEQDHHILVREHKSCSSVAKHSIYEVGHRKDRDPLVYETSTVTSGHAWILVCRLGSS